MHIGKKHAIVFVLLLLVAGGIGAGVIYKQEQEKATAHITEVGSYRKSPEIIALKESLEGYLGEWGSTYRPEACRIIFEPISYNESSGSPEIGGQPIAPSYSSQIGQDITGIVDKAPAKFISSLEFIPKVSEAIEADENLQQDLEAVHSATELNPKSDYCNRVDFSLRETVNHPIYDIIDGDFATSGVLSDPQQKEGVVRGIEFGISELANKPVPAEFKAEHAGIVSSLTTILSRIQDNTNRSPALIANLKSDIAAIQLALASISDKSADVPDTIEATVEALNRLHN